jgi:hypothetical protein
MNAGQSLYRKQISGEFLPEIYHTAKLCKMIYLEFKTLDLTL